MLSAAGFFCSGTVWLGLKFISGAVFASYRDRSALELRRLKERLHPAKIMRCDDQPEKPVDFVQAAQFDLPHGPVQLGPAEDLLSQLAFALADGEARTVAFGLGEEAGRLRVRLILGYMRHNLAPADGR